MKTYAVCELEEHLNEILRLVQEKKEVIEITSGGELIAHVIPAGLTYKPDWLVPPEGDVWANLDRLSAEIGAHWPKDVSAVDAIRDVRGDL
jgi:hypothetical protein